MHVLVQCEAVMTGTLVAAHSVLTDVLAPTIVHCTFILVCKHTTNTYIRQTRLQTSYFDINVTQLIYPSFNLTLVKWSVKPNGCHIYGVDIPGYILL